MHLYIQSGVFAGFFVIFNLKKNLNDFFIYLFSILQTALPTKTPYAHVVQIPNQLNKILDLMHLYIQCGFFAKFFAFFHLRTKLNKKFHLNFFSILQNCITY
jgi:hypothetical protein